MIIAVALLLTLALGGVAFAFAGGDVKSRKRVASVSNPGGKARGRGGPTAAENQAQKRKNVAAMLKDVEKNRAAKKEKPTMRRRLEQAGFSKATPRSFWMVCGIFAALAATLCVATHQKPLVIAMAAFVLGLGLPRWILGFLTARRKKKFTENFAPAIDVIVRSVKSGLPINEALRIVAREAPNPVGSEFNNLVESQGKSGGNLSEALGNLAFVLRDRKRLQGKIKAMSSEAKASAAIIGSLPPGVMGIVYVTTPAYIMKLFTTQTGNLILAGCAVWMSIGIMVMRKMINFKH
jgi:tight adherence protein B